jgi:hypothetical protein
LEFAYTSVPECGSTVSFVLYPTFNRVKCCEVHEGPVWGTQVADFLVAQTSAMGR